MVFKTIKEIIEDKTDDIDEDLIGLQFEILKFRNIKTVNRNSREIEKELKNIRNDVLAIFQIVNNKLIELEIDVKNSKLPLRFAYFRMMTNLITQLKAKIKELSSRTLIIRKDYYLAKVKSIVQSIRYLRNVIRRERGDITIKEKV